MPKADRLDPLHIGLFKDMKQLSRLPLVFIDWDPHSFHYIMLSLYQVNTVREVDCLQENFSRSINHIQWVNYNLLFHVYEVELYAILWGFVLELVDHPYMLAFWEGYHPGDQLLHAILHVMEGQKVACLALKVESFLLSLIKLFFFNRSLTRSRQFIISSEIIDVSLIIVLLEGTTQDSGFCDIVLLSSIKHFRKDWRTPLSVFRLNLWVFLDWIFLIIGEIFDVLLFQEVFNGDKLCSFLSLILGILITHHKLFQDWIALSLCLLDWFRVLCITTIVKVLFIILLICSLIFSVAFLITMLLIFSREFFLKTLFLSIVLSLGGPPPSFFLPHPLSWGHILFITTVIQQLFSALKLLLKFRV